MAIPKEKPMVFLITDEYSELKGKVHDRLVDMLDLSLIDSLDRQLLKQEIRRITERILAEESKTPLNYEEREQFHEEIFNEVLGLGPIEPFMHDPSVSDILVNSYRHVYVERYGKIHLTGTRFKDDNHLKKIIDRIVSAVGRRIDESSPMVDARLPDGSRVNAVVPPVSVDGPSLSIRRFAVDPLEMDDLLTLKTVIPEIGELFKGIVRSRLNVLISGGTGSGKTTLLNVLSRFIPPNERIVTIEDSAELQMKQEHVVRLETRPSNIEGKGEVTQRDLVRNSLRMRPDRIVVGEVPQRRGPRHAPGHEHRPRRLAHHHPRQLSPGRPAAPRDARGHDGAQHPQRGGQALHQLGHPRRHPHLAPRGRKPQGCQFPGDYGHGGKHRYDAGDLRLRADRDRRSRPREGTICHEGVPAEVHGAFRGPRRADPVQHLRCQQVL